MDEKDILFLKEEYAMAQANMLDYEASGVTNMAQFYQGQKRGIEMALVRCGILNDELDKICQEIYRKFKGEDV